MSLGGGGGGGVGSSRENQFESLNNVLALGLTCYLSLLP